MEPLLHLRSTGQRQSGWKGLAYVGMGACSAYNRCAACWSRLIALLHLCVAVQTSAVQPVYKSSCTNQGPRGNFAA